MLFLKCIDSFGSILEIVICVERGIKILCVECEMNTCNGIEMYVNWKKGVDKTGNFMWTETSWSLQISYFLLEGIVVTTELSYYRTETLKHKKKEKKNTEIIELQKPSRLYLGDLTLPKANFSS